ncbi:peptidoglycan D,D-transpeptidase FtsI family protein [Ferdinandcohnia quinoae]|uniref:serine-type D-Ala-D-Ala carboxypeptidase n=1 Tax=Fredinandcohnia quinoae TaxID=2918902 RepID=A0AAW5E4E5_9BACI|nr:penicillin-binding protein 2 [Fredinandcohnia sp. SECRCQ15]MCH1624942.1 penicillin-binding protein 2 [Fredinandcohnia sp. SECRCQ15]
MKKKKKSHVPFRLNILFFLVFLLFSALVLRLGVVQIVHGEKFQKEVDKTENKVVNLPVPRGKIYDANGRVIVDNKAQNAITYTRAQGTKQEDVLEVAKKLAQFIQMDTDKIRERDLKDFWLLNNPEEAKEKVDKELKDEEKYNNSDIYKLQLERITEEELSEITEDELEVAAIFREMNKGYALVPQIIKNVNVTDKEYAVVSENLENLPGINTTTDWERYNKFGTTLNSILGKTTTTDEGLPSEKLDYYLARGYNRNDRVGKSYLEEEYESVLHGKKAKVENVIKGNSVMDTIVKSAGQRGSDLVLTIDMDLQIAVEQIIEEQIKAFKPITDSPFLDRAFVVMMNPKTGEILSMAGKTYEKDSETGKYVFKDYALGAMNSAYEMGSSIKGATVLTGFQTGAIHPGERMMDEPMYINDLRKASITNMGRIDDLKAIERSSNVYMWKTVIKLAKGNYIPHKPLPIDPEAFKTVRNYYSQFGLGVKTGIDLPGEAAGFIGTGVKPGNLMDLAIGQYDTYTPLQLAQYVSTIANDGYRMQPKIVKEIHQPTLEEGQLGPIQRAFEPTVLNRIDVDSEYIERVQEGFYRVMHGSQGSARGLFKDKSYDPAGKTGSAESFYYENETGKLYETVNSTLVGYAPFDNPEVAFAVVIPYAYKSKSHVMNQKIGEAILDKYFELKAKDRTVTDQEQTTTTENINDTEQGTNDSEIE